MEGSDIHPSVVTRYFPTGDGLFKQITATLDCNWLRDT